MNAIRVGLVTVDADGTWIGGRYYLHHLIRCVASLPHKPVSMTDIYWGKAPDSDPYLEVRSLMNASQVLSLPQTTSGRFQRKLRRVLRRDHTAADLFEDAAIDVTYPLPLIENQGTPLVYWLADLQFRIMPELYPQDVLARMEYDVQRHSAAAARIVASSQTAASDIAHFYPEVAEKIDIVRFCSVPSEEWWSEDPVQTATKHRLPERFFILPNQFTAHKNQMMAVEALAILRDRGVHAHVVSTGSTYDFRSGDRRPYYELVCERAQALGVEDRFTALGLIPRAEYIALLRRSLAILQPSRFEGWSTVIEDGKTLGKRIVASDIAVNREQLGAEHRYYASPNDRDAWADAMSSIASTANPGPDVADEAAGLERLSVAQRATGEAFVHAIRSALKR